MRIHPAIVALLSAAAVAACDASRTPEIAGLGPAGGGNGGRVTLIITPNQVQIPVATTLPLSVNVPDSLRTQVVWTSSQPSFASVNQLGVVTGLSPGTTIIVARFFDNADTTNRGLATVTVTAGTSGASR